MLEKPAPQFVSSRGTPAEGYVVLPFGKDEFRDFIQSLLGTPQTITKRIAGTFEISRQDLVNIYTLLLQRIQQQNEAQLIQFRTRLVFNDASSVLLGSVEDLSAYNEVRPVVATAVHMTWEFLVKFQDKKNPEKQKITISIVTSVDDLPEEGFYIDEDEEHGGFGYNASSGYFVTRVEHTARTWGADIESLLTNHFRSIIRRPAKWKTLLGKWKYRVESIIVGTTILCSIAGIAFAMHRLKVALKSKADAIISEGTSLDNQVKALIQLSSDDPWARFSITSICFLVGLVVGAWFLGRLAFHAAIQDEPSFLMLTGKSAEHREKKLRRYRRAGLRFSLATLFALAMNVASNWIFLLLFPAT